MIGSSLSAGSWAALLAAWIAAVASPGPDIFLLMRLAIRQRRAALLAALGIMTGNTLWILSSVLGISVLLVALPWLLPAVQTVGAAVLLWLGIASLRGGIAGLRAVRDDAEAQGPRRPYLLGLATNIANPKALIFFTALLGQFLPPQASMADRGLVIVVMISTGLVWFLSVAAACSARAFRNWFRRAAPWFDIVAGAVFVLVAGAVLVEVLLEAFGALG